MDNFLKGLEQLGKVVYTTGQRVEKWLEENGIESRDFNGVVAELSQNLYENTKPIIDHNSQFGWTLSASMQPFVYIDDALLEKSKEELDNHFYRYYSEDDWDNYKDLKSNILKDIDPKWNELIGECFYLFENNRYRVAIPILFSILDAELAKALVSYRYGKKLVTDTETAAEREKARLRKSVLYSIVKCFRGEMFSHSPFDEKRKSILNRNWVMHGRDDPKLWEEVDVLRLLTILDSVQFARLMEMDEE